jgi:hypothetical protein
MRFLLEAASSDLRPDSDVEFQRGFNDITHSVQIPEIHRDVYWVKCENFEKVTLNVGQSCAATGG